jgi:hypothetical protein
MHIHNYLVSPVQFDKNKNDPKAMPRVVLSSFRYFFERLHPNVGALFSDTKLRDYFAIAFNAIRSQVIQQPPPLADNLQQAPARPMVFFVGFEMLGQVRNAFTQ